MLDWGAHAARLWVSGPSHLRRQRNNPSGRSSKFEIIVVLVRPDPEPVVMAFAFAGESTIAATNLDGVNAAFLAET